MNPAVVKYGGFVLAVLILVGLDQWTKQLAEDRLATQRPGIFSHNMVLEVPPEHDGSTLKEYLVDELRFSSEEEIDEIASRFTVTEEGRALTGATELEAGEVIEIRHREVVVIEGYWDFQYTRNPGAAFGLFADADESFRRPFLLTVSLIAVFVILWMLFTMQRGQWILYWGLTTIAAGALGNVIDRIRFGYVIDFVVWKLGDDYRWPTFNVADVLICIGVGLIILEMIREGVAEHRAKKEAKAES